MTEGKFWLGMFVVSNVYISGLEGREVTVLGTTNIQAPENSEDLDEEEIRQRTLHISQLKNHYKIIKNYM